MHVVVRAPLADAIEKYSPRLAQPINSLAFVHPWQHQEQLRGHDNSLLIYKELTAMADQFFFDAAVNTCDSAGNIDDQAQTTMGEQKTFSQFNQWTLVDHSDVEEMETKAAEEFGGSERVNETFLDVESKNENKIVETLIDEEASNGSYVPSDEGYESEELVSRETLLRISEQARLRSNYILNVSNYYLTNTSE